MIYHPPSPTLSLPISHTSTWPREVAATAGEKKREENEKRSFRLKLRGITPDGALLPNVRVLVGEVIDCMDSNGRWFQTEISEIETVRPPGGSGGGSKSKVGCAVICPIPVFTTMDRNGTGHLQTVVGEVKAIRVDFSDAGGREEWIFVDSDRLAPAEKFTRDSLQCMENLELGSNGVSNGSNGSSNQQSKDTPAARQSLILRKNSNSNSNSALLKPSPPTVCSYPGFGACGLTNLDITCYINSAVQCIGYMPLLRSYLVSGKYRRNGDLNRDNPLGTGGKIFEEFAELLRVMWSGKVDNENKD